MLACTEAPPAIYGRGLYTHDPIYKSDCHRGCSPRQGILPTINNLSCRHVIMTMIACNKSPPMHWLWGKMRCPTRPWLKKNCVSKQRVKVISLVAKIVNDHNHDPPLPGRLAV